MFRNITGALGLIALASCGGALGNVKSNNGQMKVTIADDGLPTFDWKACTSFGLKNCAPDEFKVVGLGVNALGCTDDGTQTGKRRPAWSISVESDNKVRGVEPLTPPIHYGVLPKGAYEDLKARPITAGCKYIIFFNVQDGGTGTTITEDFVPGK